MSPVTVPTTVRTHSFGSVYTVLRGRDKLVTDEVKEGTGSIEGKWKGEESREKLQFKVWNGEGTVLEGSGKRELEGSRRRTRRGGENLLT